MTALFARKALAELLVWQMEKSNPIESGASRQKFTRRGNQAGSINICAARSTLEYCQRRSVK
jgi:hypothetical protein